MNFVVYGLRQTRITLYNADGTNAYRVTLQKEGRMGLELAFPPEGVDHQLGSGADWEMTRTHRGFRPALAIKWPVATRSVVETWDGAQWGAKELVLTAQVRGLIDNFAFIKPCLVSPHEDMNFGFLARPVPANPFKLRDIKGVAHADIDLALIATKLIPAIPDWPNLNKYVADGYVASGYVEFAP
jgi:hypothetical protein